MTRAEGYRWGSLLRPQRSSRTPPSHRPVGLTALPFFPGLFSAATLPSPRRGPTAMTSRGSQIATKTFRGKHSKNHIYPVSINEGGWRWGLSYRWMVEVMGGMFQNWKLQNRGRAWLQALTSYVTACEWLSPPPPPQPQFPPQGNGQWRWNHLVSLWRGSAEGLTE